jgi:hypothetical protein
MSKFNEGKPYHGSEYVKGGKLKGTTDTDYFYFICPRCQDNQVMRILEYTIQEEMKENPYNNSFKKKAKNGFTLAFHIYCEKCKLDDFVKISNFGWQGGSFDTALSEKKSTE